MSLIFFFFMEGVLDKDGKQTNKSRNKLTKKKDELLS